MQRVPSSMLFIGLTIAFTVAGQLLVKRGMVTVGSMPAGDPIVRYVWHTLTNVSVMAGLACAVIAALTWMMALSKSALSFAYPFMGLAIVLVLALSPLLFGEKVPLVRWLGVLVVSAGLWLSVSQG